MRQLQKVRFTGIAKTASELWQENWFRVGEHKGTKTKYLRLLRVKIIDLSSLYPGLQAIPSPGISFPAAT